MRLIDADKLIKELKINIGEVRNLEVLEGILLAIELIKEQPTVNPQYLATVKVDFSKEDIEKLVEQKVKESIDINIDGLRDVLMEYFNVGKHGTCRYGMMCRGNFYEIEEDDVKDIIKFIKENKEL